MAYFLEKENQMFRRVENWEIEKVSKDNKIVCAVIVEKKETGHQWLLTARLNGTKIIKENGIPKTVPIYKGLNEIERKLEEEDRTVITLKDGSTRTRTKKSYELIQVIKGKEFLEELELESTTVRDSIVIEEPKEIAESTIKGDIVSKYSDTGNTDNTDKEDLIDDSVSVSEESPAEVEYETMTYAQVKEVAKSKGIKVFGKKMSELISELKQL